jgi:hypothetical protein
MDAMDISVKMAGRVLFTINEEFAVALINGSAVNAKQVLVMFLIHASLTVFITEFVLWRL